MASMSMVTGDRVGVVVESCHLYDLQCTCI